MAFVPHKRPTIRPRLLLAAGVCVAFVGAHRTSANADAAHENAARVPAPPAAAPLAASGIVDPAARAIIDRMLTAQAGLNSYSATVNAEIQQGPQKETTRSVMSYEQPNKFYVQVTHADNSEETYISDGVNRYADDSDSPKTYTKASADPGRENILKVLRDSDSLGPLSIFAMITSGKAQTADYLKGPISVRKGPDEILDGVPVDVISTVSVSTTIFSNGDHNDTRYDLVQLFLSSGKSDHLLRRIVLVLPAIENGAVKGTVNFTETFTKVRANPRLPVPTFMFTPAPGATSTPEEK